jgi:hypothetical protein
VATIKIQLDRLAYAAGETIDLSGSTILYEGNKEMMAEVVLMGYYRLSTYMMSTTAHREHSLGQIPLVRYSQMTLNDTNKNNKFTIPPVYPSFYGGVKELKQRSHYSCLQWTYTIGVKIGGDGCSTHVQAALPILISSAPPYNEALKEHQGLTPKNATFGIWDVFDHAVLGPEEGCTTAPTITGPEDGGTITAVGTPITTWEDQDDNNYIGSGEGQESMSYQPFISTFNGPMDQTIDQDPMTIPMVPAEPISNPNILIDSLLKTMDMEFDKRLAVGTWVINNPTKVQQLSPDQLYVILSKVTFSLDQPSVVNELVAAFEGSTNLTCHHIVRSMQACPYQKTEIALIMAPYASDPQNKDTVLNDLDYSFDRDMVAEKFHT